MRDDVHAGTPGWKVLRILISMAAMQGQRLAICDIVAAFLHAWMDELLAVQAPRGLLADGEVFVPAKALYGTRCASNLWQAWCSKLFSSMDGRRDVPLRLSSRGRARRRWPATATTSWCRDQTRSTRRWSTC